LESSLGKRLFANEKRGELIGRREVNSKSPNINRREKGGEKKVLTGRKA